MKFEISLDTETRQVSVSKDGVKLNSSSFSAGNYTGYDRREKTAYVSWTEDLGNSKYLSHSITFTEDGDVQTYSSAVSKDQGIAQQVGELVEVVKAAASLKNLFK